MCHTVNTLDTKYHVAYEALHLLDAGKKLSTKFFVSIKNLLK